MKEQLNDTEYSPFIPLEYFKESQPILSKILCPLCKGVPYIPVTDSCGHIFCKQCSTNYVQNNKICPVTKTFFRNKILLPDIKLENLVNAQIVKCKNFNLGCSWEGLVRNYSDHLLKDCVIQRNIFCQQNIRKRERTPRKKKSEEETDDSYHTRKKKEKATIEKKSRVRKVKRKKSDKSKQTSYIKIFQTKKTLSRKSSLYSDEESSIISEKENNINNSLISTKNKNYAVIQINNNNYFDLEKVSKEVLIENNKIKIPSNNSHEHKFIFSTISFNPKSSLIYKWTVKCFCKSDWFFIGMCHKNRVFANNLKITSSQPNFNNNIFGISTNRYSWNSNNQKENMHYLSRLPLSFENETIIFEYDTEENNLMCYCQNVNIKINLTNIINEETINEELTPCFIYLNPGDEAELSVE